MDVILINLFYFVGLFMLSYILYSVFLNKNRKEYSKLKKNDEVKFFIARYNLNMKKTNYKDVLRSVTIMNCIIISFAATIIFNIESIIWSVLVSFIVVVALTYSLYEIVGRYYKRKEDRKDV